MGRRTLSTLVVLLLLAVAASGCGQRDEPVGELAQTYPVEARGAADGPTLLERRPERIVALDAGSAELVAALGAADRLVGAPPGVVDGAASVVKANGQILVDEAAELEPDLVIVTPATDRVATVQVERRTEASVYVQPAATIEDVERAVLELGFLLDEPVRARKLVGELRARTAELDARLNGVDPVTAFVDTGFFITVPDESLLGGLVQRARGVNVAGKDAGLGPFDLDRLAELDPEVYLALSDSGTTVQKLERRPETQGLRAVREGRFVRLDPALVTRAGPRIAEAYAAVAEALHPDAASG